MQDISNICSDVWEATLTTDGCMDKGPNESTEEEHLQNETLTLYEHKYLKYV